MNIFATYKCPIKSAKYLDSKRIVKMILESAQLLSTAINECGGNGPYKSNHVNHPCSIWVRQSRKNYRWLLQHFIALCRQYTKTYGKIHKSQRLVYIFYTNINRIPDKPMADFANCAANKDTGINFKHVKDVHKAYRLYLDTRFKTDKRLAYCKLGGY